MPPFSRLCLLLGAFFGTLFTNSGFANTITLSEYNPQPETFELASPQVGILLLCEQGDKAIKNNTQCGITAGGATIVHVPSDYIQWMNGSVAGTVQTKFCSDQDPGPNPNDTGDKPCKPAVDTNLVGNFAIIEAPKLQVGGQERTVWVPQKGQPGYGIQGSATVDYVLVSDIPEPSPSNLLIAFALITAGCQLTIRFRQRR